MGVVNNLFAFHSSQTMKLQHVVATAWMAATQAFVPSMFVQHGKDHRTSDIPTSSSCTFLTSSLILGATKRGPSISKKSNETSSDFYNSKINGNTDNGNAVNVDRRPAPLAQNFTSSTSSTAAPISSVPPATTTTNNNNNAFLCPSLNVLDIDPTDVRIAKISQPSESIDTDRTPKDDDEEEELRKRMPFVNMFRGSANYIANHRNTLAVYHIPGGLLDDLHPDGETGHDYNGENKSTGNVRSSTLFQDLMNDVALTWLLGMKIVLVVGCRPQIEKRLANNENGTTESSPSLSSPDTDTSATTSARQFGLRVTDSETLRIVKEEAGYVRFEVERQLAKSLRMQGGASGTAGGDQNSKGYYYDGNVVSGNFYSAQPFGILDGINYEYTGFVRRVEKEKIRQLHKSRDICLLTTLGVSPSGEVYNVNSESLAAVTAGALEASKVIYFTEKEMELRSKEHNKKIQSLRVSDAKSLLDHHGIRIHQKGFVDVSEHDGNTSELDTDSKEMLLKIGWSVQALEKGVKRAHIISPKHGALLQELYTRDGSGTLVSGDLYDGIRQADVHDVGGIHDLISPLIRMGTLIDRPKATLEKDITSYYVFTRDDHIVACGQLKIFEQGFAEIGCLVVNQDYRSRGRGDAMLGYLERLCLLNGCGSIFVLSTQTMEWFIERDFEEVTVDRLPPSRRKSYNYKRNSKIYMKKIESDRDLDASELFWTR